MSCDLKDLLLASPMDQQEYMRINMEHPPQKLYSDTIKMKKYPEMGIFTSKSKDECMV